MFDVVHGRYPSRKRGTVPSFAFCQMPLPFVFGTGLTRLVSVVQSFFIAECAHVEAFLQGTPMPEWEYIKFDLNDLPSKASEIDVLNDAGKDGWELVTITHNNIGYVKRQIRKPTSNSAQSVR